MTMMPAAMTEKVPELPPKKLNPAREINTFATAGITYIKIFFPILA